MIWERIDDFVRLEWSMDDGRVKAHRTQSGRQTKNDELSRKKVELMMES